MYCGGRSLEGNFLVQVAYNLTKVRPLFTLSHRGSDPLCDSVNRGLTLVRLGCIESNMYFV